MKRYDIAYLTKELKEAYVALDRERAIIKRLRWELSYLHKGPRDDRQEYIDELEFDRAALQGTLMGERGRLKRYQFEVLALRDWIAGDRGVTDPDLSNFYRKAGVKRP